MPRAARKTPVNAAGRREQRAILRKRDGDTCWICGEAMLFDDQASDLYATMDHVTRHADKGRQVIKNLRLAHRICNELRGARQVGQANVVKLLERRTVARSDQPV